MNNIKKLRLEVELSQETLAKLARISRATLIKWEKKTDLEATITTSKIAKALKCSIEDLGVIA